MKWSDEHDLMLCREVLLLEPFKHPRQSKERGEIWGEIALSLNSISSPKFKVSKRSVRDRLTLLLAKYKEKMRKEEQGSGVACDDETEIEVALSIPQRIVRNNKTYTSNDDIADQFNKHFVNVGPGLASKIEDSYENPTQYILSSPANSFVMSTVTETQVLNLFMTLDKNKSSIDIPNNLIKLAAEPDYQHLLPKFLTIQFKLELYQIF